MNGNFEIDRSVYPYGPVQVGDGVKLFYIPMQQCVFDLKLPRELAARVALRVNSLHYAGDAGAEKFKSTPAQVGKIIGEEITALVKDRTLSGPQATQLQLLVDGVVNA